VTIGISDKESSVLEISLPTITDGAFNDWMISATPLAKTTTRETLNDVWVVSEIDLTSS
jgi:hypothetical protein